MKIDRLFIKGVITLAIITSVYIHNSENAMATNIKRNNTVRPNISNNRIKQNNLSGSIGSNLGIGDDIYKLPSISPKLQGMIDRDKNDRIKRSVSEPKYKLPEISAKLQGMIDRSNNMYRKSMKLTVTKGGLVTKGDLIGSIRTEGEPNNTSGLFGRSLGDFDLGTIGSDIISTAWYLQYKDEDGKVHTKISSTRPKVVLSNGTIDVDFYYDVKNNKQVHYQHRGEGNWISGKLLIKKALDMNYPITVRE